MTPFEHKGYLGLPRLEVDDGVIAGRILGIDAIVTFEGDTIPEARKAFEDSVDVYLQWCADRGEKPERPFSGKVTMRIGSDLHRALALAAATGGMTLDEAAVAALRAAFPAVPQAGRPIHGRPYEGHAVEPQDAAPAPVHSPSKAAQRYREGRLGKRKGRAG